MTRLPPLLLAVACTACSAHGVANADPRFVFASQARGAHILGASDEFVERLSPFDRAARMKSDRAVSALEFRRFAATNVLPWEVHEKEKIEAAFRQIGPRLTELSVGLPKTVYLIKTTGEEEGDTPYTRDDAIVIPRGRLAAPSAEFPQLISHELFHILLRHDEALRERLYRLIGFLPCGEVVLPPPLAQRTITNPDAPRTDYRIRVRIGPDAVWAVPVLYSSSETYDPARGGVFFDYLQFRLMVVEKTGDGPCRPVYERGEPRLIELHDVAGFFEQVGRNTEYVIHPEEILADNFALLVLGKTELPSPQILVRLRQALALDPAPGH
jgi:hypothetical protein